MNKIIVAVFLSISIFATPSAARAEYDAPDLMVPTTTGIVSGYIYGGLIKSNQWVALLLANVLISRCKDRIFRHFDRASREAVASLDAKQLASMLSLSCETKKEDNGVIRSTYAINIDDANKAPRNRYTEMSDLDDLITLLAALLTLGY